MTDKVVIRPISENEREAWNPLWAGYLAFYKSALTREISDLTWHRFHDPDEHGGIWFRVVGRLSNLKTETLCAWRFCSVVRI